MIQNSGAMKWVLDNTVMSNFALVRRAVWLRQLGEGHVLTVQDAWNELQAGMAKGILPQDDWSWLPIARLTSTEKERLAQVMPPLDSGEAACLALAQSRGFGVLTDDRLARRYARLMGIPLSGTLGVLKVLVERKYITLSQADETLHQLIALGYFSPITSLKELG